MLPVGNIAALSISTLPTRSPVSALLGRVIHRDSIAVMRTMPSQIVDLIATDPAYLVN
jgi:hypothetical protein